jgi:urease accessory protein
MAPPSLPSRTTYCVAAGAATARLGATSQTALSAYVTGIVANIIAASIRLGVCGQSGGVRVLATLGPVICDLAIRAAGAGEDDLGGCALGADIAGMRHETLNGRLFLS